MVLIKRVGAYLKEAREAKKLSIKEVARQTNITGKYLEALENEDYSQFPGETYALGFLRNYSEFLNLDTDHLMQLYRGHDGWICCRISGLRGNHHGSAGRY